MICPSQSGLGVELIRAPVCTLPETLGYFGMPWKDLGGLVKNKGPCQPLEFLLNQAAAAVFRMWREMAVEPTRDESEGPAVTAPAQARDKEPDEEEGPALAAPLAQASDKERDEAEATAVVATLPAKASDEIQDEEEGAAVATPPP